MSAVLMGKSGHAIFEVVPKEKEQMEGPASAGPNMRARSSLESLSKAAAPREGKRWSRGSAPARMDPSVVTTERESRGIVSRVLGWWHSLRHPTGVQPLEKQVAKASSDRLRDHLNTSKAANTRKMRHSAPAKVTRSSQYRLEIIAEGTEHSPCEFTKESRNATRSTELARDCNLPWEPDTVLTQTG